MAKKKKLNVYVLLDRTGSMGSRWDESLSAINAYAKKMGADTEVKSKITVACFDFVMNIHESPDIGFKFDILRNRVKSKNFLPLTNTDASPRGMTPLFDAIGQVTAMAEAAGKKNTVIVVVTDGAENCSKELTKSKARAVLDRCKERGWQVVFLGAEFDASGEAASVGVDRGQTLTMARGKYAATMSSLASKSRAYAFSGDNLEFTEEDRAELSR